MSILPNLFIETEISRYFKKYSLLCTSYIVLWNMGKIILENIRIYSNHGCLDEEALIGSDYVVDLEIEADLSKSAETDELGDTVDYVHLNRIVKEEVSIRSKLLEKVADRVLQRIGKEIFMVSFARVKLSKMNPPIGGNVEKVSIILEKKFSV